MKLGVLLLGSPYQTEDVDSCIHFVERALEKGHEVVGIFLLAEGLYNLNSKIQAPGDRNLAEELNALAARVRVVGCGTCARFRGVVKADVIKNASIAGLSDLVEMLEASDRFVTFGG